MSDEGDESVVYPADLAELRHVTVYARDPNGWGLEVTYLDSMSPYEVWGMLLQAAKNIEDELEAANTADESTET